MRPPPAPGRLDDVGGHRLHVHCRGSGPTVLFDAALGASSVSWTYVQPLVARFAAACVYDRAGFGWSDGGPRPRTVARITGELRTVVDVARLSRPLVLVGHSYGAMVARMYAIRYPEDVSGLVLVDPPDLDLWSDPSDARRALIERAVRLCRYGERAARLRIIDLIVFLMSVGAFESARTCGRLVSGGLFQRSDECVLGPAAQLPADLRRVALRFWTQPRFFEALGSQLASLSASAGELRVARELADIPVVVISAGQQTTAAQTEAHARLAACWPRGRQVIAENSGHWIPLDQPELVAAAIQEVVRCCCAATSIGSSSIPSTVLTRSGAESM